MVWTMSPTRAPSARSIVSGRIVSVIREDSSSAGCVGLKIAWALRGLAFVSGHASSPFFDTTLKLPSNSSTMGTKKVTRKKSPDQ